MAAKTNIETVNNSFQTRQIKQEQAQMHAQALSDYSNQPMSNASREDMLRSIMNMYSSKQASDLTPFERFLSPSPTDSPFPLHEKIGMEQNGIAFGSYESLSKRNEMVEKVVYV